MEYFILATIAITVIAIAAHILHDELIIEEILPQFVSAVASAMWVVYAGWVLYKLTQLLAKM